MITYSRPWITVASAATAILGSILGGVTGAIDPISATQGVIAGAAVLGVGRKLEAIRQLLALIGTISGQVQVPIDPPQPPVGPFRR